MATHPQWPRAFLQLGIKVQQRHSCQSVRKDLGDPFVGCSGVRKIRFLDWSSWVIRLPSMAGDAELLDGCAQQTHLESQRKFTKRKPCHAASLSAAVTVIPLKKRLGGICNIDGEPHL